MGVLPDRAASWLIDLRRAGAGVLTKLGHKLEPTGCPLSWTPTPLTPVSSGRVDVTVAQGAPLETRLWYPARSGGSMLRGCGRFPLVVLVHGQCVTDQAPHRHWEAIGVSLARSGYVVAAPNFGGGIDFHSDAVAASIDATVRWARDASPAAPIVFPYEIGIAGHSYGGLAAIRYAVRASMPAVSTVAVLGSAISEDVENVDLLRQRFSGARLFAFGGADIFGQVPDRDWSAAAGRGHAVRFTTANHWDCFPPIPPTPCATGFAERGSCDHTWRMTTDVVTVFFGKYLHPHLGSLPPDHLPDSLIPPRLHPTPEQAPYASGHLQGFADLGDQAGDCGGTSRWRTSFIGSPGSTTFP